jgi:hypothetical protein
VERSIPQEKRKIPWKILLQAGIVLIALGLSFYLHQILKKTGKGDPNPAPGGNPAERSGESG